MKQSIKSISPKPLSKFPSLKQKESKGPMPLRKLSFTSAIKSLFDSLVEQTEGNQKPFLSEEKVKKVPSKTAEFFNPASERNRKTPEVQRSNEIGRAKNSSNSNVI